MNEELKQGSSPDVPEDKELMQIRKKLQDALDVLEGKMLEELVEKYGLQEDAESLKKRQKAVADFNGPEKVASLTAWQEGLEKLADATADGRGRAQKCLNEALFYREIGDMGYALEILEHEALMQAEQMGFDDLAEGINKIVTLTINSAFVSMHEVLNSLHELN